MIHRYPTKQIKTSTVRLLKDGVVFELKQISDGDVIDDASQYIMNSLIGDLFKDHPSLRVLDVQGSRYLISVFPDAEIPAWCNELHDNLDEGLHNNFIDDLPFLTEPRLSSIIGISRDIDGMALIEFTPEKIILPMSQMITDHIKNHLRGVNPTLQ